MIRNEADPVLQQLGQHTEQIIEAGELAEQPAREVAFEPGAAAPIFLDTNLGLNLV